MSGDSTSSGVRSSGRSRTVSAGSRVAIAFVILMVSATVAAAVPPGGLEGDRTLAAGGSADTALQPALHETGDPLLSGGGPVADDGAGTDGRHAAGENGSVSGAPENDTGTGTPENNTEAGDGPPSHAEPGSVVVASEPADPDGDDRYEDVNGDGRVSVTDSQALLANLDHPVVAGNASRYDFTADNATDAADAAWLFRTTVDLPLDDADGDGLTDEYERTVAGTDPNDLDSDSAHTNATDADDGRIDGREDFDADTLPTVTEQFYGTDPHDADTDGDGLDDGYESRRKAFDPLDPRSVGAVVDDGEADLDGDGLTSVEEVRNRTAPEVADTDGDGVDDGAELRNGTDPLSRDTDGDGLPDAEEAALPADPTDPDTDDDGVPDGEETFERTVEDDATGVAIDLRGQGASDAEIAPKADFFEGSDAAAGPTVRITNTTDFEEATVRLPVDESVPATKRHDLAIYTWNGSVDDHWTELDTRVEDGTAIATVSSFSYFTVLDTDEWTGYVRLDPGDTEPLELESQAGFTCDGACNVTNSTELTLGGTPSAQRIVIEQGGDAHEVVPLSNGQPIEAFYDYADAEINSPLPVAKGDTSRLWFWSGPNGISFVTVHDLPRDGSGAAMDLAFDGLPTDEGDWVVEDDPNDFHRDAATPTEPRFAWSNDNTDGGAFRGGLTNRTITITPRWNDDATRSPLTSGRITGWEVLTGRATDPEAIDLDMSEPVTIRVPERPERDAADGDATGGAGAASWNYSLAPDETGLTVAYQTEQTGLDPSATVTIDAANGSTVEESLSIGTVGTVQETIDVSELDGDVEVDVDVEDVSARVEVVPAPVPKDSDGDGLPDHLERQAWTMSNGPGDVFTTSPYDADTDDDGLEDGEEVRFQAIGDGEYTSYTVRTSSNPAAYDTDGDGLNDSLEARGLEEDSPARQRTTAIASDPQTSRDFLEAHRAEEADADSHLESISVGSSPLSAHSDTDGIPDGLEEELGLAPSRADTDFDGIDDDVERERQWYPRLHEYRPPRLHGHVETDGDREQYRVTLTARDQSGVAALRAYKQGDQQASAEFDGWTEVEEWDLEFTIDRGYLDQGWQAVSGWVEPSDARVEAEDVHGSTTELRVYGPNNFGLAAEGASDIAYVGDMPYVGEWIETSSVAFLAQWSGIAHGVNVFVDDVVTAAYVATHPSEYDEAAEGAQEALEQLHAMTVDSDERERAFSAIVQHYGTRRAQLNPFENDGHDREAFAIGFTVGNGGSFLIPVYAEARAVQTASRLPYIAALIRSVGTVQRSIKGVTMGSAMWTGGKIADRLPDVDVGTASRVGDVEVSDRARRIIGQTGDALAETPLPSQRRVANALDSDRGRRVVDALERSDTPRAVEKGIVYVRRTGETGVRVLDELRPEPRRYLLNLRHKAVLQRQLTEAVARGEASPGDVGRAARTYDELGVVDRRAYERLLDRNGPGAVSVTAEMDRNALERLLDFDDTRRIGPRVAPDGGENPVDVIVRRAADDPAVESNRLLTVLDELEDEQQRRATLGYLADHPHSGRLIDDLGADEFGALLRGDADLDEAFYTYGELPAEHRSRFAALLRDGDVSDSWLRVVSDDAIPADEASTALARADDISDHGRVRDFTTGREINDELRDQYDEFQPVHRPNSIVIDYEIDHDATYYRFYSGDSDSDIVGPYAFRDRELVEQYGADDISDRLALPNDPDSVAIIEIEPGDTPVEMRVSTTAENDWGSGGGSQYIFRRSDAGLESDWFEPHEELTAKLRSSG